jgi:hypothetical protein
MLPMTKDTGPIEAPPGAVLARGSEVTGGERDIYVTLRPIAETVQEKG